MVQNEPLWVVEMHNLADAVGYACTRRASKQCSDWGIGFLFTMISSRAESSTRRLHLLRSGGARVQGLIAYLDLSAETEQFVSCPIQMKASQEARFGLLDLSCCRNLVVRRRGPRT